MAPVLTRPQAVAFSGTPSDDAVVVELHKLDHVAVLERLEEKWERDRLEAVPYYHGLVAGEHDALIRSFAGEPVLHDPLHNRVKGAGAFAAYVTELNAWLAARNMSFEPVEDVITRTKAFEEVVLHLDAKQGEFGCRWRSSPTGRPTGCSPSCACTTACGR